MGSSGFEREGILPFSKKRDDVPLVASESLEGAGSLSSNAENSLVSAVLGDFGSSAVDVLLAPVIDIVEDADFDNCAALSLGCFTCILIECSKDEYLSLSRL